MASLGKAKVQGLIVDRREVGEVGAFTSMTDEELLEEAKKRAAALGIFPRNSTANCRTSIMKCNSLPEEPCKSLLTCCFALLL